MDQTSTALVKQGELHWRSLGRKELGKPLEMKEYFAINEFAWQRAPEA